MKHATVLTTDLADGLILSPERYDPREGSWQRLAAMPSVRMHVQVPERSRVPSARAPVASLLVRFLLTIRMVVSAQL